ncbi:MAG: sporulation protein SpoOM [Verrucomicrobiota bacterium]
MNWQRNIWIAVSVFLGFSLGNVTAKPSAAKVPDTLEAFPLENIVPNMKGTTYTVLQGTEIVPVETIILGVEKNGLGPGYDMVIAKLVDPKTVLTNAVHGMSGSPMWAVDPTDGRLKLVGALSRRIAFFEKDGHCGYTPIGDMLDVDKHVQGGATVASQSKAEPGICSMAGSKYRPMAVPLSISSGQIDLWNQLLEKAGISSDLFVATPGGGQKPELDLEAGDLVPGAPVAAVLMTGDVGIAGTGTLTWRDGDRVLGFGHPMFGFGESNLPMATAEIITTIPSYMMPFKLSNTGKIVGTVTQDRWSAIGGKVGPSPTLSTYRIERTHNGQARPEIKGEFYPHKLLTPMLLTMAFQQAVAINDDMSRQMEIKITGELEFEGQPALTLDNYLASEQMPQFAAAFAFFMPLLNLYGQTDERLRATDLKLKIETNEKPTMLRLERIMTDRKKYQPGEKVKVYAEIKEDYGDRSLEEFEFTLPESIRSGPVQLRVGMASSVDGEKVSRRFFNARGVAQRIEALNERRPDNTLVLQVSTAAPGLMVRDQELPALPESARRLLTGANSSESRRALSRQVWLEQDKRLGGEIYGQQRLDIEVER